MINVTTFRTDAKYNFIGRTETPSSKINNA